MGRHISRLSDQTAAHAQASTTVALRAGHIGNPEGEVDRLSGSPSEMQRTGRKTIGGERDGERGERLKINGRPTNPHTKIDGIWKRAKGDEPSYASLGGSCVLPWNTHAIKTQLVLAIRVRRHLVGQVKRRDVRPMGWTFHHRAGLQNQPPYGRLSHVSRLRAGSRVTHRTIRKKMEAPLS